MKSYVVGGAVRDRLLGSPVVDRDHVVIGATVDDMLAAGFKPVGRDFPVFLHPTTHEEYALARTERKVAPGYAGFVFHADPSVTLQADLERRDLTINAMAEDEESGDLTDPFDGRRDLALRLFRHVGPAFVEDPVRLLRVARFAARFVDFGIAPETLAMLQRMTRDGEIDALVPERVWQELARGLMEARPSRMVEVLRETGALTRLLPELDREFEADATPDRGAPALDALDRAAADDSPIEVRFAALTQSIGETAGRGAIEALCRRLGVPRAVREVALLATSERLPLLAGFRGDATGDAMRAAVEAIERCDAFRRRARFAQVVEAIGWTIADEEQRHHFVDGLTRAVAAAAAVDAGAVARDARYDPALIGERLRAARQSAVMTAADDARTPTDR